MHVRSTSVLLAFLAVVSSGCGEPPVEFWVADYLPVREARVATERLIPPTEDAAPLLDAGWQPLDADDAGAGLWVYGREADFRFWAVTVTDLTLEMEARQYAHPEAPAQVVDVSVNGTPAGLKSIPKRWQQIEVPLPAEAVRHGWNRVRLTFRHAAAPDDYDPTSDDRRRLAARFRWLRIRVGDDRSAWSRNPGTISMKRTDGDVPLLEMPTDSMLEATLVPGPQGRLAGSVDVSVATSGVTAAVELVDGDGATHTLYERRFDGPPWWRDGIDLSLAEWAGQPVSLRLVSRGPGRGVVRWYGAGLTDASDSPFSGDPPAHAAPPRSSGRFAGHDVVVILVDTLRADAVDDPGAGPPTPNIDGLAAEGTRFRQAWAPSSWTGQALPALLSGTYPDAIGAETWESSLPEAAPSLTELFAATGYFTSLWSQHNVYRINGTLRRGFEAFADVPSVPAHRERLPEAGDLLAADRPSFAFVHLLPPHQPYEPPAPFRGSLTGSDEAFDVAGSELRRRAEEGIVTPEFLRYARARYDENVVFADHLVGRVLETMREADAYEDALIVLLSDHGEGFYEHGLFLHSEELYEEFLHVPLIVKWPASGGDSAAGDSAAGDSAAGDSVARGFAAEIDAPVSLVDVLATLADAAGLDASEIRSQGRSLVPLVFDAAGRERDVYAYTRGRTRVETEPFPVYALRSGRYKVIHDPRAGTTELYNLLEDPDETSDLASVLPLRTALLMDKLSLTRHQNALYRAVITDGMDAIELDEDALRELRELGYIR